MGIGQLLGIDNLPFPASRVGSLAVSGAVTATPNSIGAVSGDLAVAFGGSSVTSGSGNAWTHALGGPGFAIYYKILEAGDTSAGITLTGAGNAGAVVIWHGPTSIVFRSSGGYSDPTSGATFAGYTKNTAYCGQFAYARYTSGGGGTVSVTGIAAFAGNASYSGGGFDNAIADWLYGAKPDYPDGNSFTASLGGGGGFTGAAYVFEMLR